MSSKLYSKYWHTRIGILSVSLYKDNGKSILKTNIIPIFCFPKCQRMSFTLFLGFIIKWVGGAVVINLNCFPS